MLNNFKNGIYLTSTNYFYQLSDTIYNFELQKHKQSNARFMYAQSFDKSNYGTIYLVPRTQKVNVRLIRRIELE